MKLPHLQIFSQCRVKYNKIYCKQPFAVDFFYHFHYNYSVIAHNFVMPRSGAFPSRRPGLQAALRRPQKILCLLKKPLSGSRYCNVRFRAVNKDKCAPKGKKICLKQNR